MWKATQSFVAGMVDGLQAWLSVPTVLAVLTAVALILFGLGRGLGLPRLFWHNEWRPQFAAGAATAALLLEGTLVVYLLEAHRTFPGLEGATRFSAASVVFWSALVSLAAYGVSRSRKSQ